MIQIKQVHGYVPKDMIFVDDTTNIVKVSSKSGLLIKKPVGVLKSKKENYVRLRVIAPNSEKASTKRFRLSDVISQTLTYNKSASELLVPKQLQLF